MKITFLDGTKGYSPFRVANQPAGGTVTSLTEVPQYLARHGHQVVVVSLYEKEIKHNGVLYTRDVDKFSGANVVVFNRNVINHAAVNAFPKARKVWWLHDIVDPRYLEDDAFKEVDKVVALSDYCRDSYADFYGIDADKFAVIPNGIDSTTFYDDGRERNKNLYVYASAPIKGGLGVLGYVADNMARHNPDFELRVYASQELHDLDNGPFERALAELATHPGVSVFEPVRQFELAEVLRSAWCLLMPNTYPEICSNLMLQAHACGCTVISSPIGANREFNWNGCTKRNPTDLFWFWKEFTEMAAGHYFQRRPIFGPSPHTWEEVSRRWVRLLKEYEWEATSIQSTRPEPSFVAEP